MRFGKDLKDLKNVNMKKLFRRNQIIVTTLAVMIAAAGYLNYTEKQTGDLAGGAYEAGAMDISDEDILAENQKILELQDGYEEIRSLDQDLAQIEEAESVSVDELSAVTGSGGQTTGSDAAGNGSGVGDGAGQSGAVQQYALVETIADQAGMEAGAQAGFENPGEAILTSGMSVADYIAGVQLSREQVRAKNKDALLNIINSTGIEEAAKQQAIQEMLKLTEIAEKENAAETLLMAKGFADPVVSVSADKVDVVVNASSITDAQRAQIEDIVKRKTEVGAESIIITLLNLSE